MKVQIIFSKYFLKNIFGEQKSFCFSIAQGLLKVFYFLKIFLFASPPAWKGINKLINFLPENLYPYNSPELKEYIKNLYLNQ